MVEKRIDVPHVLLTDTQATIHCYGVWYLEAHEWSGFVSYHATKAGAYRKMRELILEKWEETTTHPNDLKGYKKDKDRHRYFCKMYAWTIKPHVVEIGE